MGQFPNISAFVELASVRPSSVDSVNDTLFNQACPVTAHLPTIQVVLSDSPAGRAGTYRRRLSRPGCRVFTIARLAFKARSPLQPAFMVSLGHGYFGCLPTPGPHALGGYETCLGTNRLEVNASEHMPDHLLEMAGEMTPDD